MPRKPTKADQLDTAIRHERGRRGPDWRWQCAARVGMLPLHHVLRLDSLLLQASRYRAKHDKGLDYSVQACQDFPLIDRASALEMWPDTTLPLKILTLGGVPSEEIAKRSCLELDVVEIWQSLFFDVGNNHGARDWITTQIIQPEEQAGRGDHAMKLRMAALGGAAVARQLLDDPATPPKNEVERLQKQRNKLSFMYERAASMVLDTPESAHKFLEFHARVGFEQQRLDLAERRFLEKQVGNARRHELKLAKLQLAEQRAVATQASRSMPNRKGPGTDSAVESESVANSRIQMAPDLTGQRPASHSAPENPHAATAESEPAGTFAIWTPAILQPQVDPIDSDRMSPTAWENDS